MWYKSQGFLPAKSRIAPSTVCAVESLMISGVHIPAQTVRTGVTAVLLTVVPKSLVEHLAHSRCSVNAGDEDGIG